MVSCEIWHMTYDMWHMTHDTWHRTHDMWHVTCDELEVVNLDRTFQVASSNSLGVMVFWRYLNKGSVTKWMNQLMTRVFVEQPKCGSVKHSNRDTIKILTWLTLIMFIDLFSLNMPTNFFLFVLRQFYTLY